MPKKVYLLPKNCLLCKKEFFKKDGRISDFRVQKFCSHKCSSVYHQGERHPNWSGGIKSRPDGYIRDSKTDIYIHRIVMEKFLGRKLKKYEQVHHINHNPSDNRIENLLLTDIQEHNKIYHPKEIDEKGRFKGNK